MKKWCFLLIFVLTLTACNASESKETTGDMEEAAKTVEEVEPVEDTSAEPEPFEEPETVEEESPDAQEEEAEAVVPEEPDGTESEETIAEPEETEPEEEPEQEPEAIEKEVQSEPETNPVTGFNPLLGEWFSEEDLSATTFNEDGTLTYDDYRSGGGGAGTYTYTDNYNMSFTINGNQLAGKLENGILYMGEPQTDNAIMYNKIITDDSPPLSQGPLEQSKILGDWDEFYGETFGYTFTEEGKVYAGWDTVEEGSYKISGQKLLLTYPDGTLTGELVGDTLVFTNDHDSRPLIMVRK
ncbi:hypothetical protein JF544_07805 [Halobacillus kuroshimensis]|uniref:Lipocalin-like domain-containing protein n=1 Tax=Halobacillus kuroshimensis TaxID=302481 RepID=A0ABS3DUZ9_9BACI|nr:hypothetical protein [Halobacillus kuroshimensis]MBN8235152.1 hypothetical protein [Halobacillus kuroshimensis]